MKKIVEKKSPLRRKEMAATKAAARRWYLMDYAKGDPQPGASGVTYSPAAKKAWAKYKDLVQYAAALGRKRGILPIDLTNWVGQAIWTGDVGSVKFRKANSAETVMIPLRFLEWTPSAPAAETFPEMKMAA